MTGQCKILISNNSGSMCNIMQQCLNNCGYITDICYTSESTINKFKYFLPELLITDIDYSNPDGTEMLRQITKISNVPIIVVSQINNTVNKVICLELGCDDYITIPFENSEFTARIKAVLRRYSKGNINDEQIIFPGISANLSNYELILDGKKIEIPPKELELLFFLMKNSNIVFTREQLLDHIWGYDYFGDSRTVDVHIKRLRSKLKNYEKNWSLKTVWGVGYKFEVI